MSQVVQLPRGIRNNNPGNIRRTSGIHYVGLSVTQEDPDFFQFVSMTYGIRALMLCLMAYQKEHGCKTIREFITRWAPPNENNTEAYVTQVAKYCRVLPDAPYVLTAVNQMLLTDAISHQENGGDYLKQANLLQAAHMLIAA